MSDERAKRWKKAFENLLTLRMLTFYQVKQMAQNMPLKK
jgi:hypothetical protein